MMSSESSPAPTTDQVGSGSRIHESKDRSHHLNQEDNIDVNSRAAAAAPTAASPSGSITIRSEDDKQTGEGISNSTETTTTATNDNDNNANPPLPDEPPPSSTTIDPVDDGWQPVWEETAQAFYFYNKFTGVTTWTNPRVPEATTAPGIGSHDRIHGAAALEQDEQNTNDDDVSRSRRRRPHGGYDPSIHGDYDPTAPYAQEAAEEEAAGQNHGPLDPATMTSMYTSTGTFNRFTGKWQASSLTPENFNDENKSRRQMSAFFDVDAAANRHDGKSLKAERAGKKLTKKELKAFKDKRREKKEEKRRAWLRD